METVVALSASWFPATSRHDRGALRGEAERDSVGRPASPAERVLGDGHARAARIGGHQRAGHVGAEPARVASDALEDQRRLGRRRVGLELEGADVGGHAEEGELGQAVDAAVGRTGGDERGAGPQVEVVRGAHERGVERDQGASNSPSMPGVRPETRIRPMWSASRGKHVDDAQAWHEFPPCAAGRQSAGGTRAAPPGGERHGHVESRTWIAAPRLLRQRSGASSRRSRTCSRPGAARGRRPGVAGCSRSASQSRPARSRSGSPVPGRGSSWPQ